MPASNELVRIFAHPIGDSVNAVDARELHRTLQIGRDFSNWIKARLEELYLHEGSDWKKVNDSGSPNLANDGMRQRIDYILTIDAAKHIAMAERNGVGTRVRNYFIAAEKRLRSMPADPMAMLSDPAHLRALLLSYADRTARSEAALVAAREETDAERRAREAAEAKLAELDGAVVLHERTKRANGTHGFREAAKIIGARPHEFVEFLEAEGYCHRLGKRRRLVANERYTHLARPLFTIVHDEIDHDNGEVVRTHRTWITDHGLEVLAGRFRTWLERTRAA